MPVTNVKQIPNYPAYRQNLMARESFGGDPSAQNKLSSAKGQYQFIRKTYEKLRQKHAHLKDLPSFGKADIEDFHDAFEQLTIDTYNTLERRLKRAPTHSELYYAHHFGPNTTMRLIKARDSNPTVPMKRLISAEEFKANPYLNVETVGSWAKTVRQRFGEPPIPQVKPAIGPGSTAARGGTGGAAAATPGKLPRIDTTPPASRRPVGAGEAPGYGPGQQPMSRSFTGDRRDPSIDQEPIPQAPAPAAPPGPGYGPAGMEGMGVPPVSPPGPPQPRLAGFPRQMGDDEGVSGGAGMEGMGLEGGANLGYRDEDFRSMRRGEGLTEPPHIEMPGAPAPAIGADAALDPGADPSGGSSYVEPSREIGRFVADPDDPLSVMMMKDGATVLYLGGSTTELKWR